MLDVLNTYKVSIFRYGTALILPAQINAYIWISYALYRLRKRTIDPKSFLIPGTAEQILVTALVTAHVATSGYSSVIKKSIYKVFMYCIKKRLQR